MIPNSCVLGDSHRVYPRVYPRVYHRGYSVVLGGTRGYSVVLEGTRGCSMVLDGTRWYSGVLGGTRWYSVVLDILKQIIGESASRPGFFLISKSHFSSKMKDVD